ncbi:MAG TPA: RNA polymerase sigma factor SigJ [Microvirga sp.]|nr:RNA polymerase sigma factor SigJ [Microvirga sp.]
MSDSPRRSGGKSSRVTNETSCIALFESQRQLLLNLAYRLLGSHCDAEDAVQDTFLRWVAADFHAIDNPSAWLTTVCTRRCVDLLKAAHRQRVDYVGVWLPEPFHMTTDEPLEDVPGLPSSLSTAFLLLLDRLTPKERAAYLLREIFDCPYPEVAAALGIQEATCRKLVSRARTRIGNGRARHVAPTERQDEFLAAFQLAIATGRTESLAALLSEDVMLTADGGGKVPAISDPVHGKGQVLETIAGPLSCWWRSYEWRSGILNGMRGVLLFEGDAIAAAVTFAYDDLNRVAGIYVVRNPEKLTRFRHS